MFCKVCFDAGKPKADYQSHFVKDRPGPDGTVVCPHLLNLQCRYCKKKGHTIRHCEVLKRKEDRVGPVNHRGERRTEYRQPRVDSEEKFKVVSRRKGGRTRAPDSVVEKTEVTESRFALLKNEEPPENETGPQTVEEHTAPVLTGWAKVAAKSPAPPPALPPKDYEYETELANLPRPNPGCEYKDWGENPKGNWEGQFEPKNWAEEMEETGKSAWDTDSEDEE